jgi:HSP20 family protein
MRSTRAWPSRPTFESAFSDLDSLRHDIFRLLDPAGRGVAGSGSPGVFPPLNVGQDDDNFYLRAEVPGIRANELSISVQRNRLTIAGRRELARESERDSYHRQERPEGSFSRTLTLPTEVDAERVEAHYAHGILTLTLPKAEEAKPHQIAVHA